MFMMRTRDESNKAAREPEVKCMLIFPRSRESVARAPKTVLHKKIEGNIIIFCSLHVSLTPCSFSSTMFVRFSVIATLFVAAVQASNVLDLDTTNFDDIIGKGKPALVELCVLSWLLLHFTC